MTHARLCNGNTVYTILAVSAYDPFSALIYSLDGAHITMIYCCSRCLILYCLVNITYYKDLEPNVVRTTE